MRIKLKPFFSLLLAFGFCIFFGILLFRYTVPMKDLSLDLSLMLEDNASPEDFDDKGWTVFLQKGEVVTELTSSGFGSYTGLELGETFYFSRLLDQKLDAPTLQLDALDRNFSIFLDGKLIYTDCPQQDNRIGYLALPMAEWERMEPLTLSLPADSYGKVLTIAQSTPEYTDAASVHAIPSNVKLYCGYAYESGLIAESFRTGYLALLLFFIGFLLLITFVFKQNLKILCISLVSFLGMVLLLMGTSFSRTYWGDAFYNLGSIPHYLLTGVLVLSLSLYAGKGKKLMLLLTGFYGISFLVSFYFHLKYVFFGSGFPHGMKFFFATHWLEWLSSILFLMIFLMAVIFWRKENNFYHLFLPLTIGIEVLSLTYGIAAGKTNIEEILLSLKNGSVTILYFRLLAPFTITTLITTVIETARLEIDKKIQIRLMKQQHEVALTSYESLHTHHREVMMLRHDMLHHFHALQEMNDTRQMKDYLTTLIGQNEKIRPFVQSGNQMLDIILNGKLHTAMDLGIKIEIVKSQAPKEIPMKDAELCSLIMNIVDNAINAASKAEVENPWIRLNIYIKNNYFMFLCENAATFQKSALTEEKNILQKHGFGLKIVESIVHNYSGLFDTESTKEQHCIRIAIPLD